MPKQKRRKQPKNITPATAKANAAISQVRGPLDVAALAHQLTDPQRNHPILVLSVAAGQPGPDVDMDRLAATLPASVAVHVIADGPDTTSLAQHLGDKYLTVYGGAARTYPPGAGWMTAASAAPVRMPRQYDSRQALTDAILTDCHQVAPAPAHAASAAATDEAGLPPVIDQPHLAVKLARHLLDPHRARTVVVITRPSGKGAALIDTADVRAQLDGLADVYEVANGPVGHALSDNLPEGGTVYGGASRTYPASWNGNLDAAPLRFVWQAEQAARITDLVVSDAFHAAHRTSALFETTAAARPAAGRILGVAGNRALVTLDGGRGMAAIRPELTVDGVPADRLFTAGMRVEGMLDDKAGRLDVTAMIRSASDALAGYNSGDTVLAQVAAVTPDHAELTLFPGATVRLDRSQIIDPSRPASIAELLTVGETVAVAVMETAAGGGWQLDLTMADPDAEPVTAPPILPGGPGWLVPAPAEPVAEPEPEPGMVAAPESSPAPAPAPAPAPIPQPTAGTDPALASMTAERDQLLRDLETATRRNERAERDLARARARIREAETALAKSRRQLGAAETATDLVEREATLFADPEQQLRFEVNLAWARRIPAAEKPDRPLGRYTLGPNFLDTLTNTPGVDRSKVVDVVVEIVTGMVHEIAGRELHQLRTGTGGDDPVRTRPDGATCWRVSLQVKTPSARRLHYWMLNDGSIELSSVRVHDDFRD